MHAARVEFLGIEFDTLSADAVDEWLVERPSGAPFAYVVTPNVDHVVRLERVYPGDQVRTAYRDAALCLCDSRVLQRLAKLAGVRLTAVPGSDLTARLFEHGVVPNDRICVIGGDEALVTALRSAHSGVAIMHHAPPMGLRSNDAAMAAAADFVADIRGRYTLFAVGSPQQELLAHRIAAGGRATGIGLCIGASIEFLVGRKARAPRWMQRAGLEWLHRLASEPKRLWRRYLIEGPRVFAMTLRWRRMRR